MSDWLVAKEYDPNKTVWYVQEWNYRVERQDDWLEEGKVPGRDFVKITDEGTPEGARSQAEAYFNGTHEEPGVIDAWVQSLEGP